MARPQTEDGFVMVALDLLAAIGAADLPSRCLVVLTEAMLRLYGPRKAQSVALVPSEIEHWTGLHRNNARRAINELVSWGLLLPQADGTYRLEKDYESWRVKGSSLAGRLGGGPLRFATSAAIRHGHQSKRRHVSQSNGIVSQSRWIQVSASTSIQRDSGKCQYLNPTGLTSGSPPLQPPIEEPRARLELRIKNKDTQSARARESDDPPSSRIAVALGLVDHEGNADPAYAIPIGQWIANKPEPWVWEQVAKAKTRGNPFAYFRALMRVPPTEEEAAAAAARTTSTQPVHELAQYGELLLERQRERERRRRNGGGT